MIYLNLPRRDEAAADALSLDGWIHGEGTGIPDALSPLLILVAWDSGIGVHLYPIVDGLPIPLPIDLQPSVEDIAEVRGLPVGGRIELGYGDDPPVQATYHILGSAEIRPELSPEEGELDAVPRLFLGEPVGEVLVVVEGPGSDLGRLPELPALHPSEREIHARNQSRRGRG